MKSLFGAFNQEEALIGAFSVIVQLQTLREGSFAALLITRRAEPQNAAAGPVQQEGWAWLQRRWIFSGNSSENKIHLQRVDS